MNPFCQSPEAIKHVILRYGLYYIYMYRYYVTQPTLTKYNYYLQT